MHPLFRMRKVWYLQGHREGVADEKSLGRFNLKVSQTAPFNVFMAQSRLEELMDFQEGSM